MEDLVGQYLGRYHLQAQLGEGGMATVYKAYDTRLERTVALKVIRTDMLAPALLGQMLKRFEHEAKALAKLSHPNIVDIYDYGEHNGAPYLVMEYLPGGTLQQTGLPMPFLQAVKILLPVAEALAYAHEHSIIHRDVKPANILIDEGGRVKLSDFGIAKVLSLEEATQLTGTGVGIGTPAYMAPEQWFGDVVPATDQYALGVILYELVTGQKPYRADTPAAVLIKQMNDPLPSPRLYVPTLPVKMEQVLIKALAKQPEDRFPDMHAFCRALEGLLEEGRADAVTGRAVARGDAEKVPATMDMQVAEKPRVVEEPPAVDHPQAERQTAPAAIREPASRPPEGKKPFAWYGLGLVLVLVVVGAVWALTRPKTAEPSTDTGGTAPPAATQLSGVQANAQPSTETAAPTNPPVPTLLNPSTPGAGSVTTNRVDGADMVFVPGGNFQRGLTQDQLAALVAQCGSLCGRKNFADALNDRPVWVSSFWMYRYEVTNAQYAACVQAGRCSSPRQDKSQTRSNYFDDAQYGSYPVVYVTWGDAVSYCSWIGGRLPSEAEWEKAARGEDGRLYPWGSTLSSGSKANAAGAQSDTTQVGSYPQGASPYGALDMAGNVFEWNADWYADSYYQQAPERDPSGPASGKNRVVRGMSYTDRFPEMYSSTIFRDFYPPDSYGPDIGFRCALTMK